MDRFNKIKQIIETELRKKEVEISKAHEESLPKWVIYRKEGWESCLDYLLTEILLIENKDKGG